MTRSHAGAGRYSGRRPMTTEFQDLSPADLRSARARVAKGARLTPLLPSDALSERLGHPVALKCENLQAGGAFKIRGASNFLARTIETGTPRGVITYSSGNHAIATALAARRARVPAVAVMPGTAPGREPARVRARCAQADLARG